MPLVWTSGKKVGRKTAQSQVNKFMVKRPEASILVAKLKLMLPERQQLLQLLQLLYLLQLLQQLQLLQLLQLLPLLQLLQLLQLLSGLHDHRLSHFALLMDLFALGPLA